MLGEARRLLVLLGRRFMRRALPALFCVGIGAAAQAQQSVCSQGDGRHITKVCFASVPGAPLYGHTILGDTPEWNQLVVHWSADSQLANPARGAKTVWSQPAHIFEDTAPRLADLDRDGMPEIVVVQSSVTQGARLMVLRPRANMAVVATPYIGRKNRWLSVIGIADLDRDGFDEIAYIDRPHLAKTLRIWRYKNNKLVPVAARVGLTNHKIGENDIAGGIRICNDARPEMVVASGDWSRMIGVRLLTRGLQTRDLGPHRGRAGFATIMGCP